VHHQDRLHSAQHRAAYQQRYRSARNFQGSVAILANALPEQFLEPMVTLDQEQGKFPVHRFQIRYSVHHQVPEHPAPKEERLVR
jgi:hypothetical protein